MLGGVSPTQTNVVRADNNDRVEICHFPPGNPDNYQTITINASALAAHLAHGDFAGPCDNDCRLFGSVCDDGNACTVDSCNSDGTCRNSAPTDCDDGDVCTADSCDPVTGDCVNAPLTGGACDDGNDCTELDTCNGGACVGTEIDGCCNTVADCDDRNPCTDDACTNGACSNTPVSCPAPDLCTVATCNPTNGSCELAPKSCDDDDACTDDACDLSNGACVHTTVSCGDGNVCTDDSCDPATGCVNANNTAACDDRNACTLGDTCQNGTCTGTNPVVCTALDQCHNVGTCDPFTGACSNPNKADGSSCNDGNACTLGDTCQNGDCVGGSPVVCTASDACHVAGACDPSTGACSNPNIADGSSCDDGDPCNGLEACQSGVCESGVPVVCTALDQCHDVGTCDPATAACSNPAKPAGTACNDGSSCTLADTCQAGICTGGNPVVCTALDECHVAGTCDPTTGACSNPNKADGTACNDDSDACNGVETCQDGVCESGVTIVCPAPDQCHDAGACDPSTGLCSYPAKPDRTVCDDGNACTTNDACQAGTCAGAYPVVCTALDQCHAAGTCDPSTGVCSNPVMADGTACDDENACTQTDTCQSGACTGADPVICAAPDQCHNAAACDPSTGVCSDPPNKPDGTACNDGNACTLTDTCQDGACTGASPVVCTALDQCHNAGTCDPTTGTCSNPMTADGSSCDDGDACTLTDTCQNGACTGGNLVVCTALDQCHDAGSCDPATGACTNPATANGTSCDDGDACTLADTCQDGTCVGDSPVVCTALDQCHAAGTCNPATGVCSNPNEPDGTACDDGDAGTEPDACQNGICSGDSVCTALDQCHDVGVYDPATGECTNPPKADFTPCDDCEFPCFSIGVCFDGTCGCGPVVCTALDQCHDVGTCDNATGGCSNPAKPDGTVCDDGHAGTEYDTCQNGVCTGVSLVVCTAPDGTACDDGNACTVGDTCQGSICAGDAVVCTALDQCFDAGTCNPANGECTNPPKSDCAPCEDGDLCTIDEYCQAGECIGGSPRDCGTSDLCDPILGCFCGTRTTQPGELVGDGYCGTDPCCGVYCDPYEPGSGHRCAKRCEPVDYYYGLYGAFFDLFGCSDGCDCIDDSDCGFLLNNISNYCLSASHTDCGANYFACLDLGLPGDCATCEHRLIQQECGLVTDENGVTTIRVCRDDQTCCGDACCDNAYETCDGSGGCAFQCRVGETSCDNECCPVGQACVAGECREPCGGISCDPASQICCDAVCCDEGTQACDPFTLYSTCTEKDVCAPGEYYIRELNYCCPATAACGALWVDEWGNNRAETCCDLVTSHCDRNPCTGAGTNTCVPN